MKVINSSVEIMRTGMELTIESIHPERFIEKVGRTCYKSEDKITEASANKFVSNLIKRGHEAMLEHWTLIFKTDAEWYNQILQDFDVLLHSTVIEYRIGERLRNFLRFTDGVDDEGESRFIISGNMRAWRDYCKVCVTGFGFMPIYMYGMIRNYPLFFPEFQDWVPENIVNNILIPITVNDLIDQAEHDIHHDVTVKFICDRGVSHEIVRHRTSSFAQESTRYCNYSGDKYGKEITVIAPSWCDISNACYEYWVEGCKNAERSYFDLLDKGCSPQEARSVLPNSLKTELIMTTNLQGWKHFFGLRCAPDAHPDIRVVANMVREKFEKLDIPGFEKE